MKTLMILTLAFVASSNAKAATPIAYECSNIETPTATNDSWHLTFYNEYVSFFDNDHESLAKYTGEKATRGDSEGHVFRSVNKNDPFRIIQEDLNGWGGKAPEKIYAELYLGKAHKPTIFECNITNAKEAKKMIDEVIADQSNN